MAAILSVVVGAIGCSSDVSMKRQQGIQGGTIAFEGIPVPTTDADKRTILASPSVAINGKKHQLGYRVLMRSGDLIGGNTFGLITDQDGKVVVEKDGSRFVSNDNDFSSLLSVGDTLFSITHFESRPGAMYLTECFNGIGFSAAVVMTCVSTVPAIP